jgi:tetratricopeptide (TPR) repeat protein
MREKNKQFIICLLLSILFPQQDTYRSVDDIKKEWSGYTSHQKEELLSFSEFLFKEGHYERCLLTLFELTYKFSEDPIIPNINYHIARCYEEIGSYVLAQRYYQKVMDSESETSFVRKAANYRFSHVFLLMGKEASLLSHVGDSEDPYLVTFKGYAYMKKQNWEEARTSFIFAQSIFNHEHYNQLLTPVFKIIEDVGDLPMHNKYLVFISGSMVPGGGQFLLNESRTGQGVFISVGMMLLINSWIDSQTFLGSKRFLESEGNSVPIHKNFKSINSSRVLQNKDQIPSFLKMSRSKMKFVIPPVLVATSLYISSSLQSFYNTKRKNKELIQFYLLEELKKYPLSRFLDFPEPVLKLSE